MGRKRLTDSTVAEGGQEDQGAGVDVSRLALVSRVSDPLTSGGTDLLQRARTQFTLCLNG